MLHEIEQNTFSISETHLSQKYKWPRPKTTIPVFGKKTSPRTSNIKSVCSRICPGRNTVKNTGFSNLESGVLLRVFSHFTEKELLSRVAGVCRHWHNVARDPRLWKNLEFKDGKVDTDLMCNLLRRSPNLETLTLDAVQDPVTVIRQMCRCNNSVRHVKIINCRAGPDETIPESVLRNILHSCSKLESLNLKGTQFSAPRFYQELVNLPKLRKLNLSKNKYLRVQDLMTIALNCRNLEDVTVTRPQSRSTSLRITDQDAVFFFNNLSKSLKRIKFDTTGLSSPSFQAILGCPNLVKLSLYHALFLTGDILRDCLSKLHHLKKLRVTQACQLVSDDLVFLSKKGVFDHLTLLDLSGCWKICNVGLRSIVQHCKNHLTYLGLKSCKSMNDLHFIIDNCYKLEYLNVAHAFSLTQRCVISIPERTPKLRILVIDSNKASDDLLSALHKKMPHLSFIRSLSEFLKDEWPVCLNEDSD